MARVKNSFDTRFGAVSTSSRSATCDHDQHKRRSRREEIDTEEDSVSILSHLARHQDLISSTRYRGGKRTTTTPAAHEEDEDDRELDFRPDDMEGVGDDDIKDDWGGSITPQFRPKG